MAARARRDAVANPTTSSTTSDIFLALRDGQGRPVYVRGDDSSATTTDISLAARDSDGMPTYVRGFNVVSDANGDLYLYIDERGRVTADRSQARRDAIYAAREGARTLNPLFAATRGDDSGSPRYVYVVDPSKLGSAHTTVAEEALRGPGGGSGGSRVGA